MQDGISPGSNLLAAVEVLVSGVIVLICTSLKKYLWLYCCTCLSSVSLFALVFTILNKLHYTPGGLFMEDLPAKNIIVTILWPLIP